MLKKIISGGQTGADQGALDAAIKFGMPHGGWIPRGRKTENGTLSSIYHLDEMKSGKYNKRTRQNVIDSNGTVIFFHGELSGGSKHTEKMAVRYKKNVLSINLSEVPAFQSIVRLASWISENGISALNVAGPRASKDPQIYVAVKFIISCIILLMADDKNSGFMLEEVGPDPGHSHLLPFPKTLDEAVNRMISELPHIDKTVIANMEIEELDPVQKAFAALIRHQFGLKALLNAELVQSCREEADEEDIDENSLPTVIIHSIWENLRENDAYRMLR